MSDQMNQFRSKGMSERDATIKTIAPKKKKQKPLKFKEGGLHASTGTAPGQKISASEHSKAASGALGPKAAKQEQFYESVLKH
jgi:hypothetical protein